jgi:hypothetical protein
MKNGMEVPQKIKNRTASRSINSTVEYKSTGNDVSE